ncbi:MAG: ATP-binding protein [Candidatus Omnitrophota bacterium]|nr:ATP-binding protein [Candidatus Omnitrophota bacterium]
MLKRKNAKNWYSSVTGRAFTFLFSALFTLSSVTAGFVPMAYGAESAAASVEVESIRLPAELGSIQASYLGNSGKTVIMIQDAHANYEAQKSIEDIIHYFNREYGVRLAGLEGSSGRLDALLYRTFPEQDRLRNILDEHLRRGELSGAATASVTASESMVFEGIDKQDLYEDGIRAYIRAKTESDAFTSELALFADRLKAAKERIYPEPLLELDRNLNSFWQQDIRLDEILQLLARIKRPLTYPLVAAVLSESEIVPATDAVQAEQLVQRLHHALRLLVTDRSEQMVLNEQHQAFKTGVISLRGYAHFVSDVAKKHAVNMAPYEALTPLVENHPVLAEMQGADFFREFNEYVKEVKAGLIPNREAAQVDELDGKLAVLGRLRRLEWTPDDWAQFTQAPEEFAPASFDALLNRGEASPDQFAFTAALRFYDVAVRREASFFQKLRNLMISEDEESAMLLAGGFHTERMRDLFEANGISYVVVAPMIQELPDVGLYEGVMLGDISWKEDLVAKDGKVDLFDAFARNTAKQLLDGSRGEQRGWTLKLWRDHIIKSLASSGSLAKAGFYLRYLDQYSWGKLSLEEQTALESNWRSRLEQFLNGLEGVLVPPLAQSPTSATLYSVKPLTPGEPVSADIVILRSELREESDGGSEERRWIVKRNELAKSILDAVERAETIERVELHPRFNALDTRGRLPDRYFERLYGNEFSTAERAGELSFRILMTDLESEEFVIRITEEEVVTEEGVKTEQVLAIEPGPIPFRRKLRDLGRRLLPGVEGGRDVVGERENERQKWMMSIRLERESAIDNAFAPFSLYGIRDRLERAGRRLYDKGVIDEEVRRQTRRRTDAEFRELLRWTEVIVQEWEYVDELEIEDLRHVVTVLREIRASLAFVEERSAAIAEEAEEASEQNLEFGREALAREFETVLIDYEIAAGKLRGVANWYFPADEYARSELRSVFDPELPLTEAVRIAESLPYEMLSASDAELVLVSRNNGTVLHLLKDDALAVSYLAAERFYRRNNHLLPFRLRILGKRDPQALVISAEEEFTAAEQPVWVAQELIPEGQSLLERIRLAVDRGEEHVAQDLILRTLQYQTALWSKLDGIFDADRGIDIFTRYIVRGPKTIGVAEGSIGLTDFSQVTRNAVEIKRLLEERERDLEEIRRAVPQEPGSSVHEVLGQLKSKTPGNDIVDTLLRFFDSFPPQTDGAVLDRLALVFLERASGYYKFSAWKERQLTAYMTQPDRYELLIEWLRRYGDDLLGLAEASPERSSLLVGDFGPGYPPDAFHRLALELQDAWSERYGVETVAYGIEPYLVDAVARDPFGPTLLMRDGLIVSAQEGGSEQIYRDPRARSRGTSLRADTRPYAPYEQESRPKIAFLEGSILELDSLDDSAGLPSFPDISILSNVLIYYEGSQEAVLENFSRRMSDGQILLVASSGLIGGESTSFAVFRKRAGRLRLEELNVGVSDNDIADIPVMAGHVELWQMLSYLRGIEFPAAFLERQVDAEVLASMASFLRDRGLRVEIADVNLRTLRFLPLREQRPDEGINTIRHLLPDKGKDIVRSELRTEELAALASEWYLAEKERDADRRLYHEVSTGSHIDRREGESYSRRDRRGIRLPEDKRLPFDLRTDGTYEHEIHLNRPLYEIIQGKRTELVAQKLLDQDKPFGVLDIGSGGGYALFLLAFVIAREEFPDLVAKVVGKGDELQSDDQDLILLARTLGERYRFYGADLEIRDFDQASRYGGSSADRLSQVLNQAFRNEKVIDIQVAPAQNLPNAWSNTMHYVTSAQALRYAGDNLRVIEEMHRVLAVGGETEVDFGPGFEFSLDREADGRTFAVDVHLREALIARGHDLNMKSGGSVYSGVGRRPWATGANGYSFSEDDDGTYGRMPDQLRMRKHAGELPLIFPYRGFVRQHGFGLQDLPADERPPWADQVFVEVPAEAWEDGDKSFRPSLNYRKVDRANFILQHSKLPESANVHEFFRAEETAIADTLANPEGIGEWNMNLVEKVRQMFVALGSELDVSEGDELPASEIIDLAVRDGHTRIVVGSEEVAHAVREEGVGRGLVLEIRVPKRSELRTSPEEDRRLQDIYAKRKEDAARSALQKARQESYSTSGWAQSNITYRTVRPPRELLEKTGLLPFNFHALFEDHADQTYEGELSIGRSLYEQVMAARTRLIDSGALAEGEPYEVLDIGGGRGYGLFGLALTIGLAEIPDVTKPLIGASWAYRADGDHAEEQNLARQLAEHLKGRYSFANVDIVDRPFYTDKRSGDGVLLGSLINDELVQAGVIRKEPVSVEDLPEAWTNRFHYIMSVESMRYVGDPLRGIEEIYRVAAPGGTTRVNFGDASYPVRRVQGQAPESMQLSDLINTAEGQGYPIALVESGARYKILSTSDSDFDDYSGVTTLPDMLEVRKPRDNEHSVLFLGYRPVEYPPSGGMIYETDYPGDVPEALVVNVAADRSELRSKSHHSDEDKVVHLVFSAEQLRALLKEPGIRNKALRQEIEERLAQDYDMARHVESVARGLLTAAVGATGTEKDTRLDEINLKKLFKLLLPEILENAIDSYLQLYDVRTREDFGDSAHAVFAENLVVDVHVFTEQPPDGEADVVIHVVDNGIGPTIAESSEQKREKRVQGIFRIGGAGRGLDLEELFRRQLRGLSHFSGKIHTGVLERSTYEPESPQGGIWEFRVGAKDLLGIGNRSELRSASFERHDIYPWFERIVKELGLTESESSLIQDFLLNQFEKSPFAFSFRSPRLLLNLIELYFSPNSDGRLIASIEEFKATIGLDDTLSASNIKKDKGLLWGLYFASVLDRQRQDGDKRFDVETLSIKTRSEEVSGSVPDALIRDLFTDKTLLAEFKSITGNRGIGPLVKSWEEQMRKYVRAVLTARTADLYPPYVFSTPPDGVLLGLGNKPVLKDGKIDGDRVKQVRKKIDSWFVGLVNEERSNLRAEGIELVPAFTEDTTRPELLIGFFEQPELIADRPQTENPYAIRDEARWQTISRKLGDLQRQLRGAHAGVSRPLIYQFFKKHDPEFYERATADPVNGELLIYHRYLELGRNFKAREQVIQKGLATGVEEFRALFPVLTRETALMALVMEDVGVGETAAADLSEATRPQIDYGWNNTVSGMVTLRGLDSHVREGVNQDSLEELVRAISTFGLFLATRIRAFVPENSLRESDFHLAVVELVKNAVVHGNRMDLTQPVHVAWSVDLEQRIIRLTVADTASDEAIPAEWTDAIRAALLGLNGRGFELIENSSIGSRPVLESVLDDSGRQVGKIAVLEVPLKIVEEKLRDVTYLLSPVTQVQLVLERDPDSGSDFARIVFPEKSISSKGEIDGVLMRQIAMNLDSGETTVYDMTGIRPVGGGPLSIIDVERTSLQNLEAEGLQQIESVIQAVDKLTGEHDKDWRLPAVQDILREAHQIREPGTDTITLGTKEGREVTLRFEVSDAVNRLHIIFPHHEDPDEAEDVRYAIIVEPGASEEITADIYAENRPIAQSRSVEPTTSFILEDADLGTEYEIPLFRVMLALRRWFDSLEPSERTPLLQSAVGTFENFFDGLNEPEIERSELRSVEGVVIEGTVEGILRLLLPGVLRGEALPGTGLSALKNLLSSAPDRAELITVIRAVAARLTEELIQQPDVLLSTPAFASDVSVISPELAQFIIRHPEAFLAEIEKRRKTQKTRRLEGGVSQGLHLADLPDATSDAEALIDFLFTGDNAVVGAYDANDADIGLRKSRLQRLVPVRFVNDLIFTGTTYNSADVERPVYYDDLEAALVSRGGNPDLFFTLLIQGKTLVREARPGILPAEIRAELIKNYRQVSAVFRAIASVAPEKRIDYLRELAVNENESGIYQVTAESISRIIEIAEAAREAFSAAA